MGPADGATGNDAGTMGTIPTLTDDNASRGPCGGDGDEGAAPIPKDRVTHGPSLENGQDKQISQNEISKRAREWSEKDEEQARERVRTVVVGGAPTATATEPAPAEEPAPEVVL
jgi:hypothetical protein